MMELFGDERMGTPMKIIAIRDISSSYINTLVAHAKDINKDVVLYDFKKKSKNIFKQFGFNEDVEACHIIEELYEIGTKYQSDLWVSQFRKFMNKSYFKNRVVIIKNFNDHCDIEGLLSLGAIVMCSVKSTGKRLTKGIIPIDNMGIEEAKNIIGGFCG